MINNSISIIPIRSYSNIDTQKRQIYKENKNKAGVYKWTNIISGKFYIGSAIDLSKRINNYLSIAFLNKELKKGNSIICSALLKYNYSNFRLDILEYCDTAILIEREQYYLDNLKPEYNILKVAGSMLGFKHSKVTKEILREKNTGRLHSETTRLKLSINSSMSIPVVIKNIESDIIIEFSNITKASKYVGIRLSHFRYYLDRQPIKNKYIIIKINNEDYTVKPK